MSRFNNYLQEMALPKDMPTTALQPKSGNYSKAKPEKALGEYGTKVGKGSSRVAYRVHVEKEQFHNDTSELPQTPSGKIDTVIKLALNGKGISQNKQEIDTFHDFGEYEFLLPIIDSSEQHKKRIIIDQGGSREDHNEESVSNWIQMPFVEQIKGPKQFDKIFERYFGNLVDALKSIGENIYVDNSFQVFNEHPYIIDWLGKLEESEYINEDQWSRLQGLIELGYHGLGLGDLTRTANWGVYKGRPVLLDYGFDNITIGLYQGASKAEAYVDGKGNIRLHITKLAPRRNW